MRGIIRRLRKQRGLSQAQLAQMIGKARSTVTMYEVGANDIPVTVLYTLAKVLDVPITTFFTEELVTNAQETADI